eukprot:13456705-Alexandrium_andersonii.AAC.1
MSASLVGSEMCIRDRSVAVWRLLQPDGPQSLGPLAVLLLLCQGVEHAASLGGLARAARAGVQG